MEEKGKPEEKKLEVEKPGVGKDQEKKVQGFRGILIHAGNDGSFQMQTPGVSSLFEVFGILKKAMEVVENSMGK